MQRDTGLVVPAAYVNPTFNARRITFPNQAYRGFYYGRMMYTHGGGIDRPLSLTRMEYSDTLYQPYTIIPHVDWRGSYDYGTGATFTGRNRMFDFRGVLSNPDRRTGVGWVGIDRILVGVAQTDGVSMAVRATYTFRTFGEAAERAILLDLSVCPLPLVVFQGTGVQLSTPWARDPRHATSLVVALQPGVAWEDASVSLEFSWSEDRTGAERRSPHCLVIPDLFPSVVGSVPADRGTPQSRVVVVDFPRASIVLAGVAAHAGDDRTGNEWLQAILVRARMSRVDVDQTLVMMAPSMSLVSPVEVQERIIDRTQECLARLVGGYGVDPRIRVVVCSPQDFGRVRWLPSGACVARLPTGIGDPDAAMGAVASKYMLRLASIWWGTGCRIVGRFGLELATGIGNAVAFWEASQAYGLSFEDALARAKVQSQRAKIEDGWAALRGMARPALSTAISASLYEAFQTNADVHLQLGCLTKTYWGRFVPSQRVVESLVDFGARLPGIVEEISG